MELSLCSGCTFQPAKGSWAPLRSLAERVRAPGAPTKDIKTHVSLYWGIIQTTWMNSCPSLSRRAETMSFAEWLPVVFLIEHNRHPLLLVWIPGSSGAKFLWRYSSASPCGSSNLSPCAATASLNREISLFYSGSLDLLTPITAVVKFDRFKGNQLVTLRSSSYFTPRQFRSVWGELGVRGLFLIQQNSAHNIKFLLIKRVSILVAFTPSLESVAIVLDCASYSGIVVVMLVLSDY